MELEKLKEKEYIQRDKTISIVSANIYGLIAPLPLAVGCVIVYFLACDIRFEYGSLELLATLAIVLVGIGLATVLHEFIHGIFFASFSDKKWKSVKFGIKSLTPYCHCKEAIKVWQYRIALIMPLIFIGILPYILSILLSSIPLMLLSVLMIMGAGGDLTILCMLIKEKGETYAVDHPDKCGCIVYNEKQS